MSATVALAELDSAALTVAGKIPATLGDPAAMTNDQLADIVIEAVKKIRDRLPYIRALKARFDSGDRDSTNRLKTPIKGCVTWGEFCDVHLDRGDSAIRKALAAKPLPQPKKEPPQPSTNAEHESVWVRIKTKLSPLLPTGHDGQLELAALFEESLTVPVNPDDAEDRADVVFLLRAISKHFTSTADQLEAQ